MTSQSKKRNNFGKNSLDNVGNASMRSLQVADSALYQKFGQLPKTDQLRIAWEILRLQAQILFSKKFLWFIGGILGYFVIAYIINYRQPILDRLTPEDALPWLLEFPLTILAIYLNMQLIASEKENRTLEVMFTTAGSRYKVWLLRLGTLNLLLLTLAFLLSGLAFFAFADIEILGTAIHGFVPSYFVGAMTLFFSVKFRGGFAAGMVAAGLVTLTFMFNEALRDTRYFMYFNPYFLPRQIDPETWNLWMWQNRITVLAAGMALQFFALRGLQDRERLLR